MGKIFNKIFGILCHGIGVLLLFDIISLENLGGDPFPLIFTLLGSILIEISNK